MHFVELGQCLCEVRSKQYWRLETLKSFDEFLEKRFPGSRRKAYYLMAIHEKLTRIPKQQLREVGWSKAIELVKVARREGEAFDSATWLHKAKEMPKEGFKSEVQRHLTGKETEPWEIIYFKLYKSQIPVVEQALEVAPCGSPYVTGDVFASVNSGTVDVFTPTGGLVCTLNDGVGGLTTGSGFDAAGNFYVTTFNSGTVAKFNNSGVLQSSSFMSSNNPYRASELPPRAAYSHSASVGSRPPAHWQ